MKKKKIVKVWPRQFANKLQASCKNCGERVNIQYSQDFASAKIAPCECKKFAINEEAKSILDAIKVDVGYEVFKIINDAWKEFRQRLTRLM